MDQTMQMNPNRFINDILKPWDELNSLLVQQYAFQPDLSDVTRLAGNIAVALRHQIDFSHLNNKQANSLSLAHKVISDAGDYWKHGSLRSTERNCPISVASAFEYVDPGKVRFIRNISTLSHRSLGEYDFLLTASEAAKFWMSQHGFSVGWQGIPSCATSRLESAARLIFDPRYCINMSSVEMRFFKKSGDGELVPFDPPQVQFEIYKKS
jgi:hypothetical protein